MRASLANDNPTGSPAFYCAMRIATGLPAYCVTRTCALVTAFFALNAALGYGFTYGFRAVAARHFFTAAYHPVIFRIADYRHDAGNGITDPYLISF